MKQMKSQQGFTLIELIVVIVILGILAVTAAPKFISFTTDANKSALQGLKGGIAGSMTVVYADAAIKGVEAAATSSGATYPTAYGYPAATSASVLTAVAISASTADLNSDWFYKTGVVGGGDNTPTMTIAPSAKFSSIPADEAAVIAGNCYVTYTEAKSASVIPTLVLTTTGC